MNRTTRRDQNSRAASRDRRVKFQYKYMASRLWKYLKRFIFFIGSGFLLWLFITIVEAWLQGPESHTIYFVGKLSDKTISDVYEGLRKEIKEKKLKIDGIPVNVTSRDDYGDPYLAGILARKIAQEKDVLMIVGHGYSSTSKRALPEYLAQQPMIPVILVRETNPDFLPGFCSSPRFVCPVIRLSPTDEDQARTAVKHAIQENATSFLVVRDSENPVYSNYLANQLVSEIHKSKNYVALSTTDSAVIYPEMIRKLNVDWAFFVGDYHKALILIRQIKRHEKLSQTSTEAMHRSVGITLSDWSATRKLLAIGGNDVNGVYLTHPRSAREISDDGYINFGIDTAWMIENILEEANDTLKEQADWLSKRKRRFGRYSISEARAAIVDSVKRFAEGKSTRDLKLSPSGEDYTFDDDTKKNGRLKRGRFHVWRIMNTKFTEVLVKETSATMPVTATAK